MIQMKHLLIDANKRSGAFSYVWLLRKFDKMGSWNI